MAYRRGDGWGLLDECRCGDGGGEWFLYKNVIAGCGLENGQKYVFNRLLGCACSGFGKSKEKLRGWIQTSFLEGPERKCEKKSVHKLDDSASVTCTRGMSDHYLKTLKLKTRCHRLKRGQALRCNVTLCTSHRITPILKLTQTFFAIRSLAPVCTYAIITP